MPPTDIISPTRSTYGAEQYDHEISLVDVTSPTATDLSDSPRSSTELPSKKSTRGALREEIARRKYARFQEGRYNDEPDPQPTSNDERVEAEGSAKKKLGSRRGRLVERLHLKPKKATRVGRKEEYEVDVLYENQRGWFFCGIPLYSSNSLLNFDPAPWTTVHFKDSPVDITNAQVPDPTWIWVWKSWYVDMSHDVDEEGWEYSLSFRQGFAWHGTHPWFHSFVRRRRWLRKRVKKHSQAHHGLKGSMSEAHQLNPDYFTIHNATRERSQSPDTATNNRSSFLSGKSIDTEPNIDDEDIMNVTELIKRLKRTTIDRKMLDFFANFLENGDDEVFYLAETMPEILSLFMYQNSKRKVLQLLEQTSDEANHEDSSSKKAEGLRKAIETIESSNLRDLEYWSDCKALENTMKDLDQSEEGTSTKRSPDTEPSEELDPNDINVQISTTKIQGIPEKAGVGVEPGIMRPLGYMRDDESVSEEAEGKGKEKA